MTRETDCIDVSRVVRIRKDVRYAKFIYFSQIDKNRGSKIQVETWRKANCLERSTEDLSYRTAHVEIEWVGSTG